MVFVNVVDVVFVVTLKLNREGKKVFFTKPQILSYFFLVRLEELQRFRFSLV